VRRVGDELALLAQRNLERGEHLVERPGQSGHLVIAAQSDATREVACAGHLVHRVAEPAEWREHSAADQCAKERGEERRGDREADQCEAGARECRIDLGERTGDLERAPRSERHCVYAEVAVRRRYVCEGVRPRALRHGEHLARDELRRFAVLRIRADDLAGRVHDLREDVAAAGQRHLATATAEPVIRPRAADPRRVRGRLERVVESGLDLLLHHEVHHRAGRDRRDRDRRRGQKGDANAEGHASLST
jgi:hypothetical protein